MAEEQVEQEAVSESESCVEQLSLFREENPLKARFDAGFFKSIPRAPGVYWMLDAHGDLLYVGKAKNLVARLRSYRTGSREKLPAKTWRLVLAVDRIEWRITSSETEALLLENRLLRELKPAFNVANTRPETYLFIAHRIIEGALELRLVFDLKDLKAANPDGASYQVHGAFKGLTHVMKAYASLVRWVWAFLQDSTAWAQPLARKVAPKMIRIPAKPSGLLSTEPSARPLTERTSSEALQRCERHLSLALLGLLPLPELVLPEEEPSLFMQALWLEDQVRLQEFFARNALRLKRLRETRGEPFGFVAQEEVDDLVILSRMESTCVGPTLPLDFG